MKLLLLVLIIAVCGYGFYHYYTMNGVKTPPYKIELSQGNIEIREYSPMILATIAIEGTERKTINSGFRALADYIFANEIAMTAPVQQERQKIAMTAPVMQQADDKQWAISFVMPADATMETLPKPLNPKIELIAMPVQRWVAIRFSGRWTDRNRDEYLAQLEKFITDKGLKVVRPPRYAYYNPPWTLPFMRRNEIMFLLAE